jgi:hypothetical protein
MGNQGTGIWNNPFNTGGKNYTNASQIISNAQSYVGESKKIMEKLKSAHIRAV